HECYREGAVAARNHQADRHRGAADRSRDSRKLAAIPAEQTFAITEPDPLVRIGSQELQLRLHPESSRNRNGLDPVANETEETAEDTHRPQVAVLGACQRTDAVGRVN